MTALDAIGPYEVLSSLPNVILKRVSAFPGPVHTCSGLSLIAAHALADVAHTDILLIPGSGNATALRDASDVLAWIRAIHERTILISSVCPGSLILGAAGILSGVKATTHWAVMNRLQTWVAVPTQKRFVEMTVKLSPQQECLQVLIWLCTLQQNLLVNRWHKVCS